MLSVKYGKTDANNGEDNFYNNKPASGSGIIKRVTQAEWMASPLLYSDKSSLDCRPQRNEYNSGNRHSRRFVTRLGQR